MYETLAPMTVKHFFVLEREFAAGFAPGLQSITLISIYVNAYPSLIKRPCPSQRLCTPNLWDPHP